MKRRIFNLFFSSVAVILILASSLWTMTATGALADQANTVKVETLAQQAEEKPTDILNSVDNLSKVAQEQLNKTIEVYSFLGYLYKEAKKYVLAESTYKKVIDLSKSADNTEAYNFAIAELAAIKSLASQTDNVPKSSSTQRVSANSSRYSALRIGGCRVRCRATGLKGYMVTGYCVSC